VEVVFTITRSKQKGRKMFESMPEFFEGEGFKVWNFVCGCKKCGGRIIHSTPSEAIAYAEKFGFDPNLMTHNDLYKKLPHEVIQYLSAK
jgi:hypothetical protein